MALELKYVIIQELVKEQHKEALRLDPFDEVLPNDEVVNKLVGDIVDLYGKKNNSAHYGVFLENDEDQERRFPPKFNEYFELGEDATDGQFVSLTKIAMSELRKQANTSSASTGGYILFTEYLNEGDSFFMVVMLKPKDGIRLKKTEDGYKPEVLKQLDLGTVHQAARINFSRYEKFQKAEKEDRSEINYLSFVSPSNRQTAAGYFVTAIGCAKGTASSRATQNAIDVSKSFFKDDSNLKQHRLKFKDDIMNYFEGCAESGKSAKLTELEKLARKYFPADNAEELSDKYLSKLNSEEYAVPMEFPVHKATLKKVNYVSNKTDNWDIKVDRSVLGVHEDAKVMLKNNELIFKDLSPEFIKGLRDVLIDDGKLKS